MRPTTITFPPDGIESLGIIEFVHGMCETRNVTKKLYSILVIVALFVPFPT